jgi:hypothetical protein
MVVADLFEHGDGELLKRPGVDPVRIPLKYSAHPLPVSKEGSIVNSGR